MEIVSAYALEPPHLELLADAIGRRLGHAITLEASVDESLIGGVVIRVGDSVIDASLAGRLRELAARARLNIVLAPVADRAGRRRQLRSR